MARRSCQLKLGLKGYVIIVTIVIGAKYILKKLRRKERRGKKLERNCIRGNWRQLGVYRR
jgi:hypothetical protein